MKIATTNVCINPPFPIVQYGFIQQTEKIKKVNDDLYCRIIALDDGEGIHFQLSCDLIALPMELQQSLLTYVQSIYKDVTSLTISCTHTHFGPSPKEKMYIDYLYQIVSKALKELIFNVYQDLDIVYHVVPFEEIGCSRITKHDAKTILQTIGIYDGQDCLVMFIIHNCHPTILSCESDFFSAEYPGATLAMLQKKHPTTFFTFLQGAAGDVSSRFVRKSQNYEQVLKLAQKLANKTSALLKDVSNKKKFTSVSYKLEEVICYHEYEPINVIVPDGISEREIENIEIGKIMRQRLLSKPDELVKAIHISCLNFSNIKIVFAPNELFSAYIEGVNLDNSCLVCYSNGYAPYTIGINEKCITYETFTDTLTNKTKENIMETLKRI